MEQIGILNWIEIGKYLLLHIPNDNNYICKSGARGCALRPGRVFDVLTEGLSLCEMRLGKA